MVGLGRWLSQSYMHPMLLSTPQYNVHQHLSTQLPFSHSRGTPRELFLWQQRGLSRLEEPAQLYLPSSSRHEHESCLQAEEDLGQSENSQVLYSGGKRDCWSKGCGHLAPKYSYSNVSLSPSSTRWTQRGISATIGQLCVGQPTVHSLLTAAGRR